MRSRFGLYTRWLLPLSWGSIVLYFSLDPSPPVPDTAFLAWDKFQHAFAYGLLTFLAGIAGTSIVSERRRWIGAALLTILYGCLLEAAQALFTVSRRAEFGDIVADSVGAGLVLVAVLLSKKISPSRTS